MAKEGQTEMLKMIVGERVPSLTPILSDGDLSFNEKLARVKSMRNDVVEKLNFLWKNKTKVSSQAQSDPYFLCMYIILFCLSVNSEGGEHCTWQYRTTVMTWLSYS